MGKIFNWWNGAYVIGLALFLSGYFKSKMVFNSLISLAIIKGDSDYYYLSYGREGLLAIVLSFILLSCLFFMSRTKESS